MADSISFDGASPLRSIVSSHSAAPDEGGRYPFVAYVDLETDGARRILKRRGRGSPVGAVGGTIKAIHEFERTDPATGVVSTHVLVGTTTGIFKYAPPATFSAMALPIALTGSNWCFLNFNNRCWAVNGADAMIVYDGTAWRVAGIDAPATALSYVLTGINTVGSVFAQNEVNQITGTVPAVWPDGLAQKPIVINGIRYRISTPDIYGDGVAVPPILTLTENFHEATSAGLPYAIHAGVMDWVIGPFYAWAYEDPVTGHMSDLSPVLEITERDQFGVTPQLTIPGSAQNTAAYNAGYVRIALFRSSREGSELRKVNVVINNRNDGLPIVFTESAITCRDTSLLDTKGPQDSNRKPPAAFVAIASAIGRIFGLSMKSADIARIYFSCLPDEVPVGLGEESWPRRFNRYGIAKPTGLLSVGSNASANALLIQASDGDYTLDGYDNFTFTPPYRLPTRRAGGFLFGAIDVRGEVVQLYRDKRLYQGAIDLGAPLQDKLNAINANAIQSSRLHWFSYEEDDAVFVTFPQSPSATNDRTLVFDYDGNRVSEWSFGFAAAATLHIAGETQMWVGIGSNLHRLLDGAVFRDAGPGDAGGYYAPTFGTATVRYPTRKILRRIELWVGPAASLPETLSWALTCTLDEEAVGEAGTFYQAPAEVQSAAGRCLIWQPADPRVFNAIAVAVTFPLTETELYVERMSIVFDEAQESAEGM